MNPSSNDDDPNESLLFKERLYRLYHPETATSPTPDADADADAIPVRGDDRRQGRPTPTLKERIKMRKRHSLLLAHEEEADSSSSSSSSSSSPSLSPSSSYPTGDGMPPNAVVARRSSVLEAASALASLFGGGADASSSFPVPPPSTPPPAAAAAVEEAASWEEGDSSATAGRGIPSGSTWSMRSFALSLGIDVPLTFPQKLMMALSDPNSSDILTWLPHGNGFVIHQKRRFALEVMPRHFGGRASGIAKFTSFTRKLNRWGFKRVAKGKEMGAYYHDEFRRGDADACAAMRPLRVGGAMATASAEDDEGDDEKKDDDAREDEATNMPNKEDVPVVEDVKAVHSAGGEGDEMPPPSSHRPNGEPSSSRLKSSSPSTPFYLAHWNALEEQRQQQQQQQQQRQQQQQHQPSFGLQQQLMQHQPLAHVLSMKSISAQQKLLLLRLQQQLLQLQLHRNARQAETANSLAIQNLLGVDTTSSHNQQQIISNSWSVLKSHIERGLLDITKPATAAGDVSSPPPAPCDVRGYVHAKMRARPREVDECDDRGGKRQRAATSLAAASSQPAVVDHAVLMSQLKRLQKSNRRLAASSGASNVSGKGVDGIVPPARDVAGGIILKSNYMVFKTRATCVGGLSFID
ncbi:hypothetical protein ACHAW5_007473 [Stephanodiscus triporus]|uniref:HSF-type DNA-binding domain-containing protein n=1 Tax=Stephanodiscus triporus TaxID=2934178 RepID=A0ABD3PPF3_9STRA